MNYEFKLSNGEILRVFYNDLFKDEIKKTNGLVSFWLNNNNKNKEYLRTVRYEDDNKKFFTWNREKIFMDDFLAFTPQELVEKFKNKDEHINSEDLCHTLEKYGIDSLRMLIKVERNSFGSFSLRFKTTSNMETDEDYTWVEYKFVEDYLRMPQDGYKLKLIPSKDKEYELYSNEDFYVGDLCRLISCCRESYHLIA
ncbi:hypothetical protein [Lacrimispora amygdalina]|uniref:hypothetical protein n=1 Tax=Lacrimispora amygdalina TaxID=253257 RepID=UPI000BE304CB|nr:hypothetical protein [Lacrimispora amygdalina]